MNGNFNLEYWPIIYLKISNNEMNDELFEEYKKYYLTLLLRCKRNNERIILICNLNDFTNDIPLKYIMGQIEFNKEIYKFNKEYLMCVCILCKNKSFKYILNMYFSFAKPAAPFKLCRSYSKANLFIKEKSNIDFDVSIYENNNENNLQI